MSKLILLACTVALGVQASDQYTKGQVVEVEDEEYDRLVKLGAGGEPPEGAKPANKKPARKDKAPAKTGGGEGGGGAGPDAGGGAGGDLLGGGEPNA